MRSKKLLLIIFLATLARTSIAEGGKGVIGYNDQQKSITISDAERKLSLLIDYASGCVIKQMIVNGMPTLGASGAYTGVKLSGKSFSSVAVNTPVKLIKKANGFTLSNISYGDNELLIKEEWEFTLAAGYINWTITRHYSNDALLQDASFPQWNFAGMATWKGGILDNGGMVWCKYLKQQDDTYGVHTGGVTFWEARLGNGLQISPVAWGNNSFATKYTNNKGEFTCTQILSGQPLKQQHHLSRFVSQKNDVFAPFKVKSGTVKASFSLQYIDYFKKYSRGTLPGINAVAVRELMNTTGRYGVVDNNIIGANGWLTNWKCLHEPFFAQIGMALGDKNYIRNMSATLNQERDQAMRPDGRVLSRWHDNAGDEIPGTYNPQTGYYEAMWGYTIDSQPDYVINTSEQFQLTGDVSWLQTHQSSCEKALDWLIRRDTNHNGLFEMMNNNIAEKRASDWLDIVWASYENAFVNAQMYEALKLWANCERILKNDSKGRYYDEVASRLKTAFNKPVEDGGFWSADKKQYVYWRDNDGTVHGDNLVTPVNFAAIAFKLCDDKQRIAQILDQIEQRNAAENLFHWPLCFDSFKHNEVSDGNWPFPKYENGDIFPTWGYLGIRAYCQYDKRIALKYINKLLQQYEKDGLSSQRYSRKTQQGLGDDILAGICTSITALYRDIYGLRPEWNRMGLEPNMSTELNGTAFDYTLRDTTYHITLSESNYTLSTGRFVVNGHDSFGVSNKARTFMIYPNNSTESMLHINAATDKPLKLQLIKQSEVELTWKTMSTDKYDFVLSGMQKNKAYKISMNQKTIELKSNAAGKLIFSADCKGEMAFSVIKG